MRQPRMFELTHEGIVHAGKVTAVDDAPRGLLQSYIVWNDANSNWDDVSMLSDHHRVATDDELRAVLKQWQCEDLCVNVEGDSSRPQILSSLCPIHGEKKQPEQWESMRASVAASDVEAERKITILRNAMEMLLRACEPGADRSDDEMEAFVANVRGVCSKTLDATK